MERGGEGVEGRRGDCEDIVLIECERIEGRISGRGMEACELGWW